MRIGPKKITKSPKKSLKLEQKSPKVLNKIWVFWLGGLHTATWAQI